MTEVHCLWRIQVQMSTMCPLSINIIYFRSSIFPLKERYSVDFFIHIVFIFFPLT